MRSPLITMSTIRSSGRANTFREQRARLGRPWIPGLSGSGRPGVRNRWSQAVSRGTRHSRTHSINQQFNRFIGTSPKILLGRVHSVMPLVLCHSF